MNTYLLTWNPDKWPWSNLDECIDNVKQHGVHSARWSCGQNKRIARGDRVFLIRLGKEPRGIVASGWARSSVFEDEHWEGPRRRQGKLALYVNVDFDVLLNADLREPILERNKLNVGVLARMHWDSQTSGISIPDEVARQLEVEWARVLAGRRVIQRHMAFETSILPEEVVEDRRYFEGAHKEIVVNAYERNTEARKKCIERYGFSCYVCGFNFEKAYGDLGVGFIQVHHLKSLAEIGAEYEVDPIRDLRPVCPNCHAMIHRKHPPYSLEEVRQCWEDVLNSTE